MDIAKLFSLEGRVALVTGGSRGIGRMIAQGMIAAGATVYITARREDECRETAQALGPRCHAIAADISTTAGIHSLMSAFQAAGNDRLDILVNNAGAAWTAPFDSFPETGWDKVVDLNVKSPFFLTQRCHALLCAAARPGHPAKVINVTSVDGLQLNNWETYSYHASKAGLLHLTRRLAARLITDNIVMNAIAPGAFPSRMNRAAADRADDYGSTIPAGRVGEPEDMAAAAIYLASRAGDYVVGSALIVDGGIVDAYLPDHFVPA